MESTDKLQDTLRDLKKREGEVNAYLEPLKKKYIETKTELKSLDKAMKHGQGELNTLAANIIKVKDSIDAAAGPLGEIAGKTQDKTPGVTPVKSDATPKITPKKPTRLTSNNQSVLRFEADGMIYCFGHLDRPDKKPTKFDSVHVLPLIKMRPRDAPALRVLVKFPRDEKPLPGACFDDPKFHSVWYKFKLDACEVEDHVVTDEIEFQEFLKDAPLTVHGKAKKAMERKELYRITVSYDDNEIGQDYPNGYSSSTPEIQKNFDALALVPVCKRLSIFMWMYNDLPAHLQYLYAAQKSYALHQSSSISIST